MVATAEQITPFEPVAFGSAASNISQLAFHPHSGYNAQQISGTFPASDTQNAYQVPMAPSHFGISDDDHDDDHDPDDDGDGDADLTIIAKRNFMTGSGLEIPQQRNTQTFNYRSAGTVT
jgi:hypothetical protein